MLLLVSDMYKNQNNFTNSKINDNIKRNPSVWLAKCWLGEMTLSGWTEECTDTLFDQVHNIHQLVFDMRNYNTMSFRVNVACVTRQITRGSAVKRVLLMAFDTQGTNYNMYLWKTCKEVCGNTGNGDLNFSTIEEYLTKILRVRVLESIACQQCKLQVK
jgi:hypothetical protein